jgi:hypothetical protein
MTFIFKIFLKGIMFIVSLIRQDSFHYMNTPEEAISWVKVDRIMKLWHALPSIVFSIIIALKLIPLVSIEYAEKLSKNSNIIPLTVIGVFIPILILNGIIVESILEKTNHEYKTLKKTYNNVKE